MPGPTTAREYRAALKRLQKAQRAAVNQLVSQTEYELRHNWADIPARLRPQFQALLDGYAMDMARLRSYLDDPSARLPMTWISNNEYRITQIDRAIKNAVNRYAEQAAAMVTHAQNTGAQLGADDAIALTRQALSPVQATMLGMHLGLGRPNPDAIARLIGRASNGQPLATLFQGFGAEAASAARKALLTGVALGQNPRAITTALMQALGISRNRALAIARTEMLGAYRDAALESYNANSDVVSGWIWSADQSANTCAACLFMDGSFHTLDEGMDSHVQCRCAMEPATRSWGDILGPLGFSDEDIADIPETSALVNRGPSGADWFAEQGADVQRNILGSQAAYDAYQKGDVTLGDFVGHTHDAQWGTSIVQRSWKQVQQSLKR